jgi:hypothetical protein
VVHAVYLVHSDYMARLTTELTKLLPTESRDKGIKDRFIMLTEACNHLYPCREDRTVWRSTLAVNPMEKAVRAHKLVAANALRTLRSAWHFSRHAREEFQANNASRNKYLNTLDSIEMMHAQFESLAAHCGTGSPGVLPSEAVVYESLASISRGYFEKLAEAFEPFVKPKSKPPRRPYPPTPDEDVPTEVDPPHKSCPPHDAELSAQDFPPLLPSNPMRIARSQCPPVTPVLPYSPAPVVQELQQSNVRPLARLFRTPLSQASTATMSTAPVHPYSPMVESGPRVAFTDTDGDVSEIFANVTAEVFVEPPNLQPIRFYKSLGPVCREFLRTRVLRVQQGTLAGRALRLIKYNGSNIQCEVLDEPGRCRYIRSDYVLQYGEPLPREYLL